MLHWMIDGNSISGVKLTKLFTLTRIWDKYAYDENDYGGDNDVGDKVDDDYNYDKIL